jgi:hypothetical protein
MCRIRFDSIARTQPYIIAQTTQLDRLPGTLTRPVTIPDTWQTFINDMTTALKHYDRRHVYATQLASIINHAPFCVLVDICAALITTDMDYMTKMKALTTVDVEDRMKLVHAMVSDKIKVGVVDMFKGNLCAFSNSLMKNLQVKNHRLKSSTTMRIR